MQTREIFTLTLCRQLKAAWERGDYKTPPGLGGNSRPRYTHCADPTCKEYYVLCWGPKKDPYMSHRSPSQSQCHNGGGPMTIIHRLSCELVKHFCENGGVIEAYKTCHQCNTKIATLLPTLQCEGVLNSRDPQWDIAFVKDGVTVCAIESAHTHITDNVNHRNATNIPWYEFRSLDILNQLDMQTHRIYLEDIRQCNGTPCLSEYCQRQREGVAEVYVDLGECKDEEVHVWPKDDQLNIPLPSQNAEECLTSPRHEHNHEYKPHPNHEPKPKRIEMNRCSGDGSCFSQSNDGYDQEECKHNCVLKPCPLCGSMEPQWLYYCHELRCPSCAIDTWDDTRMSLPV